jgi:hypothetical protein
LCETKPNLGTLGYLGDPTQAAGQMRQTNPIVRNKPNLAAQASPVGGLLRQTKPIWPSRRPARAPGRGKRAKQSQFLPVRPTRDAGRGPLRQTNPICPARPGMGAGSRDREAPAGTIVPNEPNSCRTGTEDHRQGQRPWRCHPAGEQLRQTNPILAIVPIGPSACPGGQILQNEPNFRQGRRG